MLGGTAGGFEGGAGERWDVEGGLSVNVRGIAAGEGGNKAVGVSDVAVEDSFPGPLRDLVDLLRIASDGSNGFAKIARLISG